MKRLHVYISVDHLNASIKFYSSMFGAEPTLLEADHANWKLEDPRIRQLLVPAAKP
jgi:hypothetical protein